MLGDKVWFPVQVKVSISSDSLFSPWIRQKKTALKDSNPTPSTCGIFTYIWWIFYGKCTEIYHTWIVWECLLGFLGGKL